MKHREMVMTALGLIELNQEVVRELLDYFPETGELIWKRRARKWFVSDGSWKSWNAKNAGKPALSTVNDRGYKAGFIFYKSYLAHRIIWLWMTGDWPDPEVDHDNQDRTDNRWKNLGEADHKYGAHNQGLHKNNTSGCGGVRQRGAGWRMQYYDREGHLRYRQFSTKKAAIDAKKATELELGYNKNHGTRKNAKKGPAPWARADGLVRLLNRW